MADPAYMHAAAMAAAASQAASQNPSGQGSPNPHFNRSPRPRTLSDNSRRDQDHKDFSLL